MSSSDRRNTGATAPASAPRRLARLSRRELGQLMVVGALSLAASGCSFRPMYAARTDGSPALRERLETIEVPELNLPKASKEARIGLAIRNALMFNLYGSGAGAPPTHRLVMKVSTSRTSVIVNNTTSLPDEEIVSIDVTYELRDNLTDKVVVSGSTFAKVSYDIPGQEQRFAKQRGLRDAEDRAAKTVADNITTRLAAYFYAGT